MTDRTGDLKPKDHAEAVATFRAELIGALTRRELTRGMLAAELAALSRQRVRPPGRKTTRHFSVPTLERWYYAYRQGGLAALRPQPRADRGHAQALAAELRELLLDIRREYPTASVPVILRTLVADGRLGVGVVSAHAVRRLLRDHGLDRRSLQAAPGGKTRRRWQAERPGLLWHGDVCHGAPLVVGDTRLPVRIHALLDDASRFVVALEAKHTEQEVDMLQIFVAALRRHGPPGSLYLDNGATYRGDVLRVACARLGIALLHARPYDPEARAKMERFWGTLRRACLDFIGSLASLHDINVRLWAFLDQHYHHAPHAGLLGRSPAAVWRDAERTRPVDTLDEAKLRDALTVRVTRRVDRDTTLKVKGQVFQLDEGYLAGARVTVAYCPLDAPLAPWVEHQDRVLRLYPVDPVHNGKRQRPPVGKPAPIRHVHFDPPAALLDRAAGRKPQHRNGDDK